MRPEQKDQEHTLSCCIQPPKNSKESHHIMDEGAEAEKVHRARTSSSVRSLPSKACLRLSPAHQLASAQLRSRCHYPCLQVRSLAGLCQWQHSNWGPELWLPDPVPPPSGHLTSAAPRPPSGSSEVTCIWPPPPQTMNTTSFLPRLQVQARHPHPVQKLPN